MVWNSFELFDRFEVIWLLPAYVLVLVDFLYECIEVFLLLIAGIVISFSVYIKYVKIIVVRNDRVFPDFVVLEWETASNDTCILSN